MSELKNKEQELIKELDEFHREKSRIRDVIGQLGGKSYNRIDMLINILFMIIIAGLFTIEVTTKLLPTLISLEIGILLVSIKIVWMIHSHNKFYHFQFWILNSIEFRMNDLIKRMRNIEKIVEEDR
jgi:hypothetical protein